MARLNSARSLKRLNNWSRVLTAQACFGLRGGLAPVLLYVSVWCADDFNNPGAHFAARGSRRRSRRCEPSICQPFFSSRGVAGAVPGLPPLELARARVAPHIATHHYTSAFLTELARVPIQSSPDCAPVRRWCRIHNARGCRRSALADGSRVADWTPIAAPSFPLRTRSHLFPLLAEWRSLDEYALSSRRTGGRCDRAYPLSLCRGGH